MTRVRFTDASGTVFGIDIQIPGGKSIAVQTVLEICNHYLQTLLSLTPDEYEKFTLSGGSMHIEFDTDDAEVQK